MAELGHKPKDMIKECRWDGEVNEMCKDFMEHGGTKVYVPKFGEKTCKNLGKFCQKCQKSSSGPTCRILLSYFLGGGIWKFLKHQNLITR